MQILNNDYWNGYLKPYVADVGVALAFGVGCLLFKAFKKEDKNMKLIKETIKTSLNKWEAATSLQRFHSLIINNTDTKTDAYKILRNMSEANITPEIVTYNCLIDMSFQLCQYENAYKLYEEISDFTFPVQPDTITYNILLKGLVKEIRENREENNSIGFSSKQIFLERITKYQNEINQRKLVKDDFTYNTMLDALVELNELESSWEIYTEMNNNNTENTTSKVIKPDIYTYTTLIKGLKNSYNNNTLSNNNEKHFNKIIEIYSDIKNNKIENLKVDEFLINSVLDSCVKYEQFETALKIFTEIEKESDITPSVITYSIILKGYSNLGKLDEAIDLYNRMKLKNVKANEVVYDCLLNCAIKCQRVDMMKDIYENMRNDKISANGVIFSTLVKGFNRTKNYNLAFQLFENMSEQQLSRTDIVFFNALLDCCIESNDKAKMIEIYSLIKKKSESTLDNKNNNDNDSNNTQDFQPTIVTYSTILKGYCKFNLEKEAIELYDKLLQSEMYLDEVFFNTMADYYSKKKDAYNALNVLKSMKEKSIIRSSVIYSILIKLFSSMNQEHKAVEIYSEMKAEGLKPTLITYTTIMQMFIRVKKMNEAINVFYEMRNSSISVDAVSYNFIINGCSFNKKLETAITILELSFKDNVKLNDNTYSNVLEYLVGNKFMKINDRCQAAGMILTNLKERGIDIKYEIYSKVMKMLYQSHEKDGAKEIEKLSGFKKFGKMNSSSNNNTNNSSKFEKKSYNNANCYKGDSIYSTPNNNNNSSNSNPNPVSTNTNTKTNNGFSRAGFKTYNQF